MGRVAAWILVTSSAPPSATSVRPRRDLGFAERSQPASMNCPEAIMFRVQTRNASKAPVPRHEADPPTPRRPAARVTTPSGASRSGPLTNSSRPARRGSLMRAPKSLQNPYPACVAPEARRPAQRTGVLKQALRRDGNGYRVVVLRYERMPDNAAVIEEFVWLSKGEVLAGALAPSSRRHLAWPWPKGARARDKRETPTGMTAR